MKKSLIILITFSLLFLTGCSTSQKTKHDEKDAIHADITVTDDNPQDVIEQTKAENGSESSSHSISELELDATTARASRQNKWATFKHFMLDGIPVIEISKSGMKSMPLLFFLHEQGGRKEDFIDIAIACAEMGYCCVLPDLPGYGEYILSDSIESIESAVMATDTISSLLDYYNGEPNVNSDRLALWGISMGGSAAYHYTAFGSKSPMAIVVACTSPDFSKIEDLGSIKNGKGAERQWDESQFIQFVKEHNPIDQIDKLVIPSVLSINGLHDDVVSVDGSQELEALYKEKGKTDCTFIYDKNAEHDITPEFIEQSFEFLKSFTMEK